MGEYKPNSDKSKREPQKNTEKVRPVVKGGTRVRRKSAFREITDGFISRDMDSVKNYVLIDVLVPAIKKAISDIVRNGIDMLLYGETSRERGREGSGGPRVSYRKFYDDGRREDRRNYSERTRVGHSFGDVEFDDLRDADEVMEQLQDILDRYGIVTVARYFELSGVADDNYTNNNYGWTEIPNNPPVMLPNGRYILRLPRPMPID